MLLLVINNLLILRFQQFQLNSAQFLFKKMFLTIFTLFFIIQIQYYIRMTHIYLRKSLYRVQK